MTGSARLALAGVIAVLACLAALFAVVQAGAQEEETYEGQSDESGLESPRESEAAPEPGDGNASAQYDLETQPDSYEGQSDQSGPLPQPVPYVEGKERHCVAGVEAASEAEASAGVTPQISCYEEFSDAIEVATDGRVTDAPDDATLAAKDPQVREEIFAPAEQSSPAQQEQTTPAAPKRTTQEPEPSPPASERTSPQTEQTTPAEQGSASLPVIEIEPMAVVGNNVVGCCTILGIQYEDADYQGNTLTYAADFGCDADGGREWQVNNVGPKWNDEITSFISSGKCQTQHFDDDFLRGPRTSPRLSDTNLEWMNDRTTSIAWY